MHFDAHSWLMHKNSLHASLFGTSQASNNCHDNRTQAIQVKGCTDIANTHISLHLYVIVHSIEGLYRLVNMTKALGHLPSHPRGERGSRIIFFP